VFHPYPIITIAAATAAVDNVSVAVGGATVMMR